MSAVARLRAQMGELEGMIADAEQQANYLHNVLHSGEGAVRMHLANLKISFALAGVLLELDARLSPLEADGK